MKIIEVQNYQEGVKAAFAETQKNLYLKNKLNIAIPGGKFGKSLIEYQAFLKLDFKNINFSLTDERITNNLMERNSYHLTESLLKLKNFNNSSFFDFSFFQDSLKLDKKIKLNKDLKLPYRFDLVYLSLGEDGHLAGHFSNSISIGSKLCITKAASKPPPTRISFQLEWLIKSSKIIIASLGNDKKKAFDSLINKKSFHSKTILDFQDNITFITYNQKKINQLT